MATNAELIDDAQQSLVHTMSDLNEDSEYYEADHAVAPLGTAMPPQMRSLKANVGYSRLYIDALNERISLGGFRYPGSVDADPELLRWWQINELDQEAPIAHLESFIHGRCYVTVSAPTREDIKLGHPRDVPLIRVESPKHMWVHTDPRTRRVEYAVRFYNNPSRAIPNNERSSYTLYLPNSTLSYDTDRQGNLVLTDEVNHNLGVVPVWPFYNRERVSDRVGRSEIIPELRSAQDVATRIVMNMQAGAELMAVPQRLLFGVAKEDIDPTGVDPYAKYQAFMANFLTFKNPEASAQQLSAAELSNYTTVLQEVAKQVASYTGLPPQYLSFASDNPSSAEAIRSAEARLVKKAELKGKMFGNCWENVMRIGMRVMKKTIDERAFRLEAIIADPSTPTWAAKADAAQKLVAGKPIIPVEQARIDLGYTPEQREDMRTMDAEERDELAAAMLGQPSTKFELPSVQAKQQETAAQTAKDVAAAAPKTNPTSNANDA